MLDECFVITAAVSLRPRGRIKKKKKKEKTTASDYFVYQPEKKNGKKVLWCGCCEAQLFLMCFYF